MTRISEILEIKTIDAEKEIALVKWTSEVNPNFLEYSTHCIFPQGCGGLHHGNYYNTLEQAQENFKSRK